MYHYFKTDMCRRRERAHLWVVLLEVYPAEHSKNEGSSLPCTRL